MRPTTRKARYCPHERLSPCGNESLHKALLCLSNDQNPVQPLNIMLILRQAALAICLAFLTAAAGEAQSHVSLAEKSSRP